MGSRRLWGVLPYLYSTLLVVTLITKNEVVANYVCDQI